MSPKFGISSPPAKLKSFKNDLAPVGFYFDIFPTNIFKIPIMPIPMRIDKMSNGRATFFIIPDLFKLDSFLETLDLVFNFESFLIEGLKNLILYSKKKYKEITYRTLTLEPLTNWFENSLNLKTEIPSLIEDFTFLLSEYLKMFAIIEKDILFQQQLPHRHRNNPRRKRHHLFTLTKTTPNGASFRAKFHANRSRRE